MSRRSTIAASLPPIAASALRRLGENIALARARRKESQRIWAERIGISIPTLIRLEKGDPGVSMGTCASALWLMGRVQALADVAAPESDATALEADLREAGRRRVVRSPHSVEARLGKASKPRP